MIEELIELLTKIQLQAGKDFSGIGIIVCDNPGNLPIFPIRLEDHAREQKSLIEIFIEISSSNSEFHDGFHIVSSKFELLKIAQYFSPPIEENATPNRERIFGGRYLAALFGSFIPTIKATGIASNGFGVAVFQNGKEVYFKSPNDKFITN